MQTVSIYFVAAPLEARSGVYRSTVDLVAAARARGHDWRALIGVRPSVSEIGRVVDEAVTEFVADRHGLDGVRQIVEQIEAVDARKSSAIITLITQSDLAVSGMNRGGAVWVAYVRGLPWPAWGEQSLRRAVGQYVLERRALRRADEVWATTEVLKEQIASARRAQIVPAGIPLLERKYFGGSDEERAAVWAGRLAVDKRPELFVEALRDRDIRGTMFGQGSLEGAVRGLLPRNVSLHGWINPSSLWDEGFAFVGTSRREAFGRSAVESASYGLPVVLGAQYGAAPLLYTDADLRARFVIGSHDPRQWGDAVHSLRANPELSKRVSNHVSANARRLTIDSSVDRILDRLEALN